MPNNIVSSWWEVPLLVCLPALFFLLVFAYLIYAGRGKRNITFNLSGLGITLRVASTDRMEAEQDVIVAAEKAGVIEEPRK